MKKSKIIFKILYLFLSSITFLSCKSETFSISILPLEKSVILNEPVSFKIFEDVSKTQNIHWDFGDGTSAKGNKVQHTFEEVGIYPVNLFQEIGGEKIRQSSAIVRVHVPETVGLPQVILDTDARNEIDDQHFIAYAVYSGVDVLAINSIHNNEDNSEEINFGEIFYVLKMLQYSGMNETPMVFRGAPQMLERPASGIWTDTHPIVTEASDAILAAARGASPANPVYILPVGPCTNIASALLQAEQDGFDLSERIRIIWLGGGPESADDETYNGGNDPWSVFVVGQSGIDFTIMLENPTSARLDFIKSQDAGLYPDNDIGTYLRDIILNRLTMHDLETKSLYDLTAISTVINNHLRLNWLTEVEDMKIADKDKAYQWEKTDDKSNVHVIWDIDEEAMKNDFFNTINGYPTKLYK